jgi:hypothetical protein
MKRFIVSAFAFAALLSACGQDVATVGKLTVNISGLPTGSAPSVAVTGPSSFTQTLNATTTLENLAPGTYTITPAKVAVAADNYTAATATTTVSAGQTASSDVTYSKSAPVEQTLVFADFTGGAADKTTQGGGFTNYSYQGNGAIATIASGQPVKGTDSLSINYTLTAGTPNQNYGGVALGADANSSGPVDGNGKPTVTPVDLTGYTKLRIKMSRSGGGALNIKVVGNDVAVQNSGCYPSYQVTAGDDGGFAVTKDLIEYTVDLSKFDPRKFCKDDPTKAQKTLAQTINNVVRVEIEDRFLPGTGSETRTSTLGSITFVK